MHWVQAEPAIAGLLVASSLVLGATGFVTSAEAAEPRRYDLDVRLEPDQREVRVAGRVRVAVDEGETALSFGLYEAFRIEECRIDGEPADCTRTTSAGTSPRDVTVPLPEGRGDGLVDLEIRYAGSIENRPGWGDPDAEGPFMDDSAGPKRVELALYSNWYPSFGYGPLFDAEVGLTLPRDWRVTCIGQEKDRRTTAEETTTRWEARSVSDVVIVASPRLRSIDVETAAGRVRIHHTRLPESYLKRDVRETEQTLLLFSEILGAAPGGQMLQHVYSPRDWGQGFARPGMIVMAEGYLLRALEEDPETSFVKGNAHEAAHFWWREGFGQGDWINEAFAEYFALLALRAAEGEEPFRADLEEKRKTVGALPDDAPAIAVVPPDNSGHGYTIRYDKGALMLEAFREHLGDEAFSRACRGFYEAIRGRKAGTADFRAYWRDTLGDDALLEAWLDSPGSRPVGGALPGAPSSPARTAPSEFPVRYSADKRYLVDQEDTPFPIPGRTAWFIASLSAPEARRFIDDTADRGFTAIEFHVVNHDARGNHPPFNGHGDLPFLARLDGRPWSGALIYDDIDAEARI